MNTIKDLAIKWWESLDEIYATKLIVKYYPLSVIDYEKIENIFYQEVVLKWYVGKYGKVEFDYNEQQIKEIYLKEHTKEQPQSVDNTIDVKEDTTFNQTLKHTMSGQQIKVRLEDAINERLKPTIDVVKGVGTIMDNTKSIMKQRRIWFSAINSEIAKEFWFTKFENKYLSQPKAIEDNVWDEIYSMHPITWETPAVQQIINHIKQHYTLIKK